MKGSSLGETHFFRHPLQFEHLVDSLSPRLHEAGGPPVRIWSAGCADGAEPYTILLCLHQRWPQLSLNKHRLFLCASDLNRASLERAESALYTKWHLRGCPELMRRRYFAQAKEMWKLDPALARHVHFFTQELVNGPLPPPQDVIFCRNVLIYLQPESVHLAIARLCQLLLPGGLLYLGFSEAALASEHPGLELLDSHLAVYRKREKTTAKSQPKPSPPVHQPLLGVGEAMRLLQQATDYAQTDQHQLVRQSLRQSLYLDPTLAVSHYQLGLLELSQGQAAGARLHWRNVIALAGQARSDQSVPGWEQCNWAQLLAWTRQQLEHISHV